MRSFEAPIPIQVMLAISLVVSAFSPAVAQVVQLPSSRSLGYSGAVSVPDGGAADLGGVSSATSSSARRGASRVTGTAVTGASLSASVQIIDLDALDEAILAVDRPRESLKGADLPAAESTSRTSPVAVSSESGSTGNLESATGRKIANSRPATDLSESISPRIGTDPGKYVRVLSGQGDPPAPASSQWESDIRYYVSQGERAENAGRVIAARVFYKMARDLMTPALVERYERIVTQRREAEEARIKAEVEAVRRKF